MPGIHPLIESSQVGSTQPELVHCKVCYNHRTRVWRVGDKFEERLGKLFSKLDLKGINTWSDENQQKVKDLIVEYEQLFALDDLELGKTDLVKHKIELHNPQTL